MRHDRPTVFGYIVVRFSLLKCVLLESDECFLEYQPIDTSLEEILIEDVSDNIRIINKTFVVEPVHVNDTSNVQRPEIPTNQDVPVAENAPIDAKVSEAFGIEEKLPIDKVEDYKRNEYLLELDEDDFKAYLVSFSEI